MAGLRKGWDLHGDGGMTGDFLALRDGEGPERLLEGIPEGWRMKRANSKQMANQFDAGWPLSCPRLPGRGCG